MGPSGLHIAPFEALVTTVRRRAPWLSWFCGARSSMTDRSVSEIRLDINYRSAVMSIPAWASGPSYPGRGWKGKCAQGEVKLRGGGSLKRYQCDQRNGQPENHFKPTVRNTLDLSRGYEVDYQHKRRLIQ